jgi:hypothetical protein
MKDSWECEKKNLWEFEKKNVWDCEIKILSASSKKESCASGKKESCASGKKESCASGKKESCASGKKESCASGYLQEAIAEYKVECPNPSEPGEKSIDIMEYSIIQEALADMGIYTPKKNQTTINGVFSKEIYPGPKSHGSWEKITEQEFESHSTPSKIENISTMEEIFQNLKSITTSRRLSRFSSPFD